MKCRDVERYAVDFLEKTLPQEVVSQIEAHLRDCPGCARLLSELSATVKACRSVPVPEFPEAAWLLRRERAVSDAVRFIRFRSLAATLASAAVLAVSIVAVRIAGDRTSPPSGWEASLSPDAIVEAVDYLETDSNIPIRTLAHPR